MSHKRLLLWGESQPDVTLTLHTTSRSNSRGGVLICPGGGYGHLADHEGTGMAEYLSAAGFDCGVLRYRLGPKHRHPAMIHDAARALRLMREAEEICATQIAVMGYSAGGHLAASLCVHHDRFVCEDDDLRDKHSARPDAAVLCYPVIDMAEGFTHERSRNNLLGPDASKEMRELMSLDRHVTADTPPTFLWHTVEDERVPMQNAMRYATACRTAGVPFELHLYELGGHGLGRAIGMPGVEGWIDLACVFMDRHLPFVDGCD